jgi:hypothetical protein
MPTGPDGCANHGLQFPRTWAHSKSICVMDVDLLVYSARYFMHQVYKPARHFSRKIYYIGRWGVYCLQRMASSEEADPFFSRLLQVRTPEIASVRGARLVIYQSRGPTSGATP